MMISAKEARRQHDWQADRLKDGYVRQALNTLENNIKETLGKYRFVELRLDNVPRNQRLEVANTICNIMGGTDLGYSTQLLIGPVTPESFNNEEVKGIKINW